MVSPGSTTPLTQAPTPGAVSESAENASPATSVDDDDQYDFDDELSGNDIAIIGMGCRVPGGNNSPSQLWAYLLNKGDASGDMPEMRWEPYNSRHPRNAEILAQTTKKGYFLDRIEDFDASFFAVSPREAEQMDPQQRIALEVAWEALEDAGIPPQSLSGTDTSVYMGVNSDDYGKLILEDLQNVGAHMGVGTAYCGIPSRISYLLNLFGPSIAIDAACASSLVAVHNARQALLAGETELAIAGGVNALIGPGLTRVLDEAGAIASDGKCRSFDDSASGYGRGEGAGIVILKRLQKAVADNDRILGVLKGSAVCADGKTVGIMAPNPVAQQIVARKALYEAKISPETISYIEAHATSTPLGDPTETAALAEVYGHGVRQSGSTPCLIGSIKSNIGHLEAGAGVMGLIKAVLVLKHGLVPPQVNLVTPSTKIDWKENMLVACKEPKPLYPSQTRHRAAVASYGYSGTVSHAIIEARRSCRAVGSESLKAPVLLLLSAPQASRIPKAADALARWLEGRGSSASLEEVANTLASRRGHHRYRASVTIQTREEAIAALQSLAQGTNTPAIVNSRASPEAAKGPVWVFSGHGAQWADMGRELYQNHESFMSLVQELEPIVQKEMGFSVVETFHSGKIDSSDVVQVMTFVMHIGIATILKEESGPPAAIIGHSLGETAASVVAGALTVHEGALIVCRRARLYRQVMGQGSMSLVSLPIAEVRSKLVEYHSEIDIAIDASPGSCVISGAKDAIANTTDLWMKDGIQCCAVKSDIAFHSRMLLPLAEPLREELKHQIFPRPPTIRLYSTSSSNPRSEALRDVDYWINNMIKPVSLRSTITAAAKDGFRAFVEVSSHPIVTHSVNETLQEEGLEDFITSATMLRNKPAMSSILTSIARIHCFGCSVAYTQKPEKPWTTEVPRTIWSHEPYWRHVAKVPLGEIKSHDPMSNNLLGTRTAIWGSDKILYQTQLDENNKPFPGKHPLHGSEIVPAAVLINTFLNAGSSNCIENLSLKVPVIVSPPRDVQVLVDQSKVSITSRLASEEAASTVDGSWLVNTTARVGTSASILSLPALDLADASSRLSQTMPSTFTTDYLTKVGVPDMGFPWRVIEHVVNDQEMLAKVETNPDDGPGMKDLWTSFFDAATSIASTIFYQDPKLRMPTACRRIIQRPDVEAPASGYIYCRKLATPSSVDVLLCSDDGTVLVEFQAMSFAGIDGEELSRKGTSGLIHRIEWKPATFSEKALQFNRVLFLTDGDSTKAEQYARQLNGKGYIISVTDNLEDVVGLDQDAIVIHIPKSANSKETVLATGSRSCQRLVSAVQTLIQNPYPAKIFCLTEKTHRPSDLGYAPLYGLSRIIQSEHPEVWGGLIEIEEGSFPLASIKYVQGEDIIRVSDGIPRTARLEAVQEPKSSGSTLPIAFQPGGTYLITGGLGALGLEVALWMVERGARRLLLISRRKLPRRSTWHEQKENTAIQKILAMEALGATVHVLPVDMSASDADTHLSFAIEQLSIPPVSGVIHAAGVLEDQLVEEITPSAFSNVLAPKITGALNLDTLYPAGSLDFFIMFSSCGQLLGFPGQASYASGNSFLDTLASQRRKQGDNAVSMMWTSWHGLGMAASTEYINAELHARGITDVTKEEAFMAWEKIMSLNTDHAVVLRALTLDADEPLPHPILRNIAPRRARVVTTLSTADSDAQIAASKARPSSGPELEAWLLERVVECVSATLAIAASEIDPTIALSEMGMDSVMTVNFRAGLQAKLKVKVPPTLVWKCPTVKHLVKHFVGELEK